MGARETALRVLMSCRNNHAWADAALKAQLGRDGLVGPEAALCSRLVYGVVQNQQLLDFYLSAYCSQKPDHLQPPLLEILRLGAYQILYLDRVPDSAAVKVVSIPGNAVPEFSGMKDFADWLKDMLAEGGNVLIKSTGQEARFSSGNVKASVKRSRSREHRNAYAGLREMVENAEYDHYEKPDERHPDRGGQDVYYSALEMSGKLYSVKLKLDVVTEEQKASERGKGIFAGEDIRYKDHKLTEIEI